MFVFGFKFSETLHFDEYNIIKFLKCFEKQCNEYEIIKKNVELNFFVTVCDLLRIL